MKERPILFSGPMVRALLEGRKTQTRRVLRSNHAKVPPAHVDMTGGLDLGGSVWVEPGGWVRCPYGQPGDRLWVKETFIHEWPDMDRPEDEDEYRRWVIPHYAATGPKPDLVDQNTERPIGWRPSIHMPRWASRLLLEVTEVRVQRLQEISEEDAMAEGILPSLKNTPRTWFAQLWASINGAESWDSNPWVWAISFKRVQP